MTKKFEDSNQSNLTFTAVCEQGHCGPNGKNVRFKYRDGLAGICAACFKALPPGPYEVIFDQVDITKHIKKTPEERAAGAVQASMRWNAKNKDKAAQYIKKYQAKAETKEKAKAHFNNLPEAVQEHRIEKQRIHARKWYDTHIRNATPEKREEYRNKWREKFKNLSDEEREYRRLRDKNYRDKKKQELLQQKGEDKDGNN